MLVCRRVPFVTGVPCPLGHYWHVAPNQFLKEDLRHHLGYYLLLGLEFLIAADIVHTLLISAPDWFLLIVLRKGLPRRCFTIDWATSLESKKQALRFVSIT